MKHNRSMIGFNSVLFAALLAAGSALGADGDKTYAAFGGNDANNCFTPFTACRTLQRAIDQANPFGTVVLDPPSYNAGTALINKPLTINFNGNQSDSPLVGSPAANLIINTPNGNDTVIIDKMNMNLLGAPRHGIQVLRGSLFFTSSTIQNVQNISGTNKVAILFQPNAFSRLNVSDSTIIRGGYGITYQGRSGADIISTIVNTNLIDGLTGIRSIPGAGSTHDVIVKNSVFTGNTIGIQSSTNRSNIRVGGSAIFGNTTGLSRVSGGLITSLTENSLTGNTTNGTFSGTVNPQ